MKVNTGDEGEYRRRIQATNTGERQVTTSDEGEHR